MGKINARKLHQEIDKIVKHYLYNVSSLKNHNYFCDRAYKKRRSNGFQIFSDESENAYIVEEERFLEGCTRVFLINPIIKMLLDGHGIDNDWKDGRTVGNWDVSNREYELGNYLEFIAILDGKRVGVRYTNTSCSEEEAIVMERDNGYLFGKKKIPGFDRLSPIEEVYVLDWSEISNKELIQMHSDKEIPIRKFFDTYFSIEEYEIVITAAKNAVKRAKEIIGLKAIPQLLPNNMLNFKQVVLDEFTEEKMDRMTYKFEEGKPYFSLGENDIRIIKEAFFVYGYRDSLVGNADFAKSFVTSEYLFRSIKEGLSIDYTSVVVGYLKSVEQLLYLLYVSAFEGKEKLEYWETIDEKNETEWGMFDVSNQEKYRFDPYKKDRRQKKDWHNKKVGNEAPEIGKLVWFLRYYDKMWAISETGKEYVCRCLNDFRKYCRNSHLHKDNIDASQYAVVERIRENTHVCVYYLLGGFKVLDSSLSVETQLGIIDYSFEMLYQEIRCKRARFFDTRLSDGLERVICYLDDDVNVASDESGIMRNAELRFVKTDITRANAYGDDLWQLMEDEAYVSNNTISITRNSMPERIEAFYPKKGSRV